MKSKRVALEDGTLDPASMEVVDTFPCENDPEEVSCTNCAGSGMSRYLPYGAYVVGVEALSNGQVVGVVEYPPDPTGFDTVTVNRETLSFYPGNLGGTAESEASFNETLYIDIQNR